MTLPGTQTIWLDGGWVRWDEARVHILTHSLHYGLAAFEGTRVYAQAGGGSAGFRLRDHLRRLEQSALILGLGLPFDRQVMLDASLEMVRRNGLEQCYLRHIAFIGHGVMGLNPQDNPVRMAIAAWSWGAYLGVDGLTRGIRCKISSYVRQFPNSAMLKAKASGNYIVSVLAKREAIQLGYDEAILLDTHGWVAEGSGENLFLVRDGALVTPPATAVLQGITRDSIMKLARREGIEVRETPFARDELYTADEVFLTGTAAEVTPVREVDGRAIGAGAPGPVTRHLQSRFFALVRGEIPEFASWLDPIPAAAPEPLAAEPAGR